MAPVEMVSQRELKTRDCTSMDSWGFRVRRGVGTRSAKLLSTESEWRKKCPQVSLLSPPTIRRSWQRHLRTAPIKMSRNEGTWARNAAMHKRMA